MIKRTPSSVASLCLALCSSLVVAACGGDDDGPVTPVADAAPTPGADAAPEAMSCTTSPECTSPEAALCLGTPGVCGTNTYCVGDDTAAEAQSDDTGYGATIVTLGPTPVVIDAHICDNGLGGDADEFDFYRFAVPSAGSVTISVAFDASADLDLAVFDSHGGNPMGYTYWQNPEVIELTYLPAGDYFLQVDAASPRSTTAIPYTVTFTQGPGVACTGVADCASTYGNQLFRAACNPTTGACERLAGHQQVALGGVCDSTDDCTPLSTCSSFPYVQHPDTRSICSLPCTSDDECAPVGTGLRCSAGTARFCLPPCTVDSECGASLQVQAAPGEDWSYGACEVATGRCTINP
jgi:hypothetical protein